MVAKDRRLRLTALEERMRNVEVGQGLVRVGLILEYEVMRDVVSRVVALEQFRAARIHGADNPIIVEDEVINLEDGDDVVYFRPNR